MLRAKKGREIALISVFQYDFMDDRKNRTDTTLMLRVKKGDKNAFKTLVISHQNQVINFIWRFMGNRTEAEDLAQEAFLRVWKSAAKYKPQSGFTTWLYRIVINLCINRRRALKIRNLFFRSLLPEYKSDRRGETESEPGIDPVTPEDHLLKVQKYRQIFNALDTLPSAQRLAIILKIYHGLSYHEISQIMDRSVSAVDALLIRAKKNLKKILKKK